MFGTVGASVGGNGCSGGGWKVSRSKIFRLASLSRAEIGRSKRRLQRVFSQVRYVVRQLQYEITIGVGVIRVEVTVTRYMI